MASQVPGVVRDGCHRDPPGSGPCYEHVAFYGSLFVFHDAVGTNKYLLSRLFGMPNPDAEYYLSVVP